MLPASPAMHPARWLRRKSSASSPFLSSPPARTPTCKFAAFRPTSSTFANSLRFPRAACFSPASTNSLSARTPTEPMLVSPWTTPSISPVGAGKSLAFSMPAARLSILKCGATPKSSIKSCSAPQYLSVRDRAPHFARRFPEIQGLRHHRSAPQRGHHARNRLLRQAVHHHDPSHHRSRWHRRRHHGRRRHFRRPQHHVLRRLRARPRNRHHARSRFLQPQRPALVPLRGLDDLHRRRHFRLSRRSPLERPHHGNDEFPDLLQPGLRLQDHLRPFVDGSSLRPGYGRSRRPSAGHPRLGPPRSRRSPRTLTLHSHSWLCSSQPCKNSLSTLRSLCSPLLSLW